MEPDEYEVEVGGGIILGAHGFATSDKDKEGIYALGLLFLAADIDHIDVYTKFTEDPTGSSDGIEQITFTDACITNTLPDTNITATARIWETVATSVAHEQSLKHTFGGHADVKISFKVLKVDTEVSAGLEWSEERASFPFS